MKRTHPKNIIIIMIGITVVLSATFFYFFKSKDLSDQSLLGESGIVPIQEIVVTTQSATRTSTEDQLLYLIEEEKLAHDVYTVMYQKYGANVFGNILESETTHQSRVLTLLQTRTISDPRSSELGIFKNQELQTLYNQLIEQGNKNATEGYKVGVIIEEKDIADISEQLATATDEDVITTLEALRRASENHLRAFNKRL